MSTTITKRRRPDDWKVEFYKNGYPKDVVVIEDTPPPQAQMTTNDEPILPSLYSSSASSSSTSSYHPTQPASAAQNLKRTLPQNFKLPPYTPNTLKKPRLDHRQPLRPFIQVFIFVHTNCIQMYSLFYS
ncbi:hypothetical protein CLU79DRAFT_770454 [Phycomyces nitens]|nr:hypothetical protein CLU79DRAFT_770454 [Phycomyces nitens]